MVTLDMFVNEKRAEKLGEHSHSEDLLERVVILNEFVAAYDIYCSHLNEDRSLSVVLTQQFLFNGCHLI